MAKKITDSDNKSIQTQDFPPDRIEPQEYDLETGKSDKDIPAPCSENKPKAQHPVSQIPEHADRILKTFFSYPELYIDSQGGTFTVDTPPTFRSNATLYTNPYHKP